MKCPPWSCQLPLTPVQLAHPLSIPTLLKPRSSRLVGFPFTLSRRAAMAVTCRVINSCVTSSDTAFQDRLQQRPRLIKRRACGSTVSARSKTKSKRQAATPIILLAPSLHILASHGNLLDP